MVTDGGQLPIAAGLVVTGYVAPSMGAPHPADVGKVLATYPIITGVWCALGMVMLPPMYSWISPLLLTALTHPAYLYLLITLIDAAVISLFAGPLHAASKPFSLVPTLAFMAWITLARFPLAWLQAAAIDAMHAVLAGLAPWPLAVPAPLPSWAAVVVAEPLVAPCTSQLVVDVVFAALLAHAILAASSYIRPLHVFAYRHALVIACALGMGNMLARHIFLHNILAIAA